MIKKIIFSVFGIFVIVFCVSSILIYSFNQSYAGRDVYLYGNRNISALFDDNDSVNCFFSSPYENMSIYSPQSIKDKNDITKAKFYGNLNQYNSITNDKITLDIWKNDFASEQLVVKNKNNLLQNVSATIEPTPGQNKNYGPITPIYGFNRYIYAENYLNGNGMRTINGVNRNLLVPDAITNEKNITMAPNNVYILWMKFMTDPDVEPGLYPFEVNLWYAGKIISTSRLTLHVVDAQVTNKVSDFNIYSFFGWTAGYYNALKTPGNIKNPNDEMEYYDYNWSRYWKPESEYLNKIYGMDYFQMPVSLSCSPDKAFEDNWNLDHNIKTQSFLHWQVNNDEDLKNHKFWISDGDWDVFDKYIENMQKIGFSKVFLTGWQYGWNTWWKTTYVWNVSKQAFEQVSMNIANKDGKINNQWMLDQIINHIDKKRSENGIKSVWNSLTFYLYLDELASSHVHDYSDMIDTDSLNQDRNAIKLAACDWEHDLDYNDSILYKIDILYVYFLDVYNQSNSEFEKMIERRDKNHLYTGQYSLESDYTFNLIRSEPGVMAYYLLALYKEGAPHFMKYILQGWNNNRSYWTSDYEEPWSGMKYMSGDTMLAYPFVDVKNQPADVAVPSEQSFDNFNPSVRLENIALGVNMNNKIDYLRQHNLMSENQYQSMMHGIDRRTNSAFVTSSTKFNFAYKDRSVEFLNKQTNSFLIRFLFQEQSDEIKVVKSINNNIEFCVKDI